LAAVLVGDEAQRLADQVDDAGLHQACGKTASIASGKPFSPSTQQISTSWTPRCFQLVEHGEPEPGAL
jgi:hypothetical protein